MSSYKFPNLTQEQRDELTLTFAACKGPIRHRWDLVVASPDQRPRFGTLALFRCDNCGTYRREHLLPDHRGSDLPRLRPPARIPRRRSVRR